MSTGRVHSLQSLGTLDGPGIRFVVFLQGCHLRCACCHNPDTWAMNEGTEYTAEEIVSRALRFREYFGVEGGITLSGGEPLLQIDFLTELFRTASAEGIHTCIDTSGATYNELDNEYLQKLDVLMKYTNLVMLDIKHINPAKHKELTGKDNNNILLFAKYLERKKIPLWVRHVVIPGYTDNRQDLFDLGKFIGTLHNLKALDVIPYHTLGVHKYTELGIPYRLNEVNLATKEQTQNAKQIILDGIRSSRQINVD